ncbi:MAG: ribosome maturation factor RimM [Terriglobales bacterium]
MTLARVLRTQGRRGEVAAELHTVSWERFPSGCRVFALDEHNPQREFVVEDSWPHKGLVVLKFRGIESISQAEALIGCEIQVPRSERLPLAAGEVYVSDLVGCAVFDRGTEVGRIAEVRFGSGDAPLLVVKAGNKEHLLPFAKAYLVKVDTEGKRLDMNLPEGMLELDH